MSSRFRLAAACSLFVCLACTAHATENGNSHADFGYIDVLAGLPPPAGLYFRDDVSVVTSNEFDDRNGNKDAINLGQRTFPIKFRATAEANIVSLAYVPDYKIPYIDGTFGIAAYDFVANSRVVLSDAFGIPERSGNDVGALGDITVVPLFVGFTVPNTPFNFIVAPFDFTAPTGRYGVSSVNNVGLNYWSYRPALEFTYLNKTGQEISLNTSLSINSQNQATHYKSGSEYYLGYVFQQHFSRKFGLGIGGYYYRQIGHDTQFGKEVDTNLTPQTLDLTNFGPGNFGETFAVGPLVTYNVNSHIFLEAHWDHEVFAYDRQKRDLVFLRAIFHL
ncbi:SphA family protein [Lichenicoccus sp.]|uniref:SphA family protein n=1 Tax=Lichenicoccus sp. TaxID=2781899 RepID=UPI003D0DD6AA